MASFMLNEKDYNREKRIVSKINLETLRTGIEL